MYPNEWVLIGNPKMDNSELNVLLGVPVLHSKDKKEVCYLGKEKTSNFKTITVIYTGTFKPVRALYSYETKLPLNKISRKGFFK